MDSSFYADDGLLVLTCLEWLEWVFGLLLGLFNQVDSRTNLRNMEDMVCHQLQIVYQYLDAA